MVIEAVPNAFLELVVLIHQLFRDGRRKMAHKSV